jgi:hypothetical protein
VEGVALNCGRRKFTAVAGRVMVSSAAHLLLQIKTKKVNSVDQKHYRATKKHP